MKKTPIIAALILLLISLVAAEEWMSFTTEDGLAHDICRCVAVNHDGNVWVGHGDAITGEGGVSMWDGETWTTYFSWTTDFGLRSNYINDIAVDQDNNIWFGTGTILFDGGLTKFDGENWTSYALDTLVEEWIFWVSDIEIDGNGNVWCATTRGAVEFDGETWRRYTTDDGLPTLSLEALHIDESNIKYFGSAAHGLAVFREFSWEYYTELDGLLNNSTIEIFALNSVIYSLQSGAGISVVLEDTICNYDSTNGLVSRNFTDVILDNSDIIFIASGNRGIFYCHIDSMDTFYNYNHLDGLASSGVSQIKVDSFNNKYFATVRGLTIYNEAGIVWSIKEEPMQNVYPKFVIYPNPFNSQCQIACDLESEISIYDVNGKLREHSIGRNLLWQPKNKRSGVYLVNIKNLKGSKTQKIFFMK